MTSFPSTGRCALRRGRVSVSGQTYLLTLTTRDRQRVFADHHCARITSRVIHNSVTWGDARLLAWVLMPDHWHGLLELGDDSLARAVSRFKAAVSRALHGDCLADGAIWDRSFHDHALRSNENVERAARYIVVNPVRAGLVKRVGDYPYWNAVWLD